MIARVPINDCAVMSVVADAAGEDDQRKILGDANFPNLLEFAGMSQGSLKLTRVGLRDEDSGAQLVEELPKV